MADLVTATSALMARIEAMEQEIDEIGETVDVADATVDALEQRFAEQVKDHIADDLWSNLLAEVDELTSGMLQETREYTDRRFNELQESATLANERIVALQRENDELREIVTSHNNQLQGVVLRLRQLEQLPTQTEQTTADER